MTIKKITPTQIKNYMVSVLDEHIDYNTDEVNCTSLAEDAAHYFDHDEWLDDSNHEVWEVAVIVGEQYKQQ